MWGKSLCTASKLIVAHPAKDLINFVENYFAFFIHIKLQQYDMPTRNGILQDINFIRNNKNFFLKYSVDKIHTLYGEINMRMYFSLSQIFIVYFLHITRS